MDVRIYDNWLFVGDERHVIPESFPIIELQPSTSASEPQPVAAPPVGFTCRFVNPLRNGNCYQKFDYPSEADYLVKRVGDAEVRALYLNGPKLIVESQGVFRIYERDSLRLIREQRWWGRDSYLSVSNGKLYSLGDDLCEYDSDGKQLSEIIISGAQQLHFYEANVIGDRFIIAGCHTYQMMPDRRDQSAFLRMFKIKDVLPPAGSLNLSDIREEKMAAYFDDLFIVPVFLTEQIVQPIRKGIVVLNYDLKVQRVIVGDFVPSFASAGLNSEIFLSAAVGDTDQLFAFTSDGHSRFKAVIPKAVGKVICPPLAATDGKIYVVGEEGVAAYDVAGQSLWQYPLGVTRSAGIYATLFNDCLVVSGGSRIVALTADGKERFAVMGFEGSITTPVVELKKGTLVVGTTAGLYEITTAH